MAQGAAVARFGKIAPEDEDKIKGLAATTENYGNFFAQNCFMGSSGTLLIVSTLNEQGYQVDALQIAGQAVPIAVISVVVGVLWGLLFDVAMKRRYGTKGGLRR